jgi:ABC-type sugar transport system ATPase subunit
MNDHLIGTNTSTSRGSDVDVFVLSVRNLKKYYGGARALDGVDLDIPSGEVTALVGHNGAGKSTLLRALSGAERPDSGIILMNGEPVTFHRPAEALAHGISCVYQELSLIPELTIAQNIFLGHEESTMLKLGKRAMLRRAQRLCDDFDINANASDPVGGLRVAQQQLVEVARATNRNTRFLLLDEPTTALGTYEVEKLLIVVRQLAQDHNVGVLLIDHKLDEVFSVAVSVTCLANGKIVMSGRTSELSREKVIGTIVGDRKETEKVLEETTSNSALSSMPAREDRPVVFTASGLHTSHLVDVNVEVRAGEILALYGLMGSGRTSFVRTVMGLYPIKSGHMALDGSEYRPSSVKMALDRKIAYVSEDRKIDGIVPSLDIYENATLPVLDRYVVRGFLRRKKLKQDITTMLAGMSTQGNLKSSIASLSGGNQQKILLARAFLQASRLLMLDEPTKGVDIGAKKEIHNLVRAMARDTGAAVIFITSEEEEALLLGDVVSIFKNGSCNGERLETSTLTMAQLKIEAWLDSEDSAS